MAGWGTSPWGTSPWGISSGPIAVESAFAGGDRFVRVSLSQQPKHRSVVAPGDALNPATWRVSVPSLGLNLTVLSVREVAPTIFDIVTLEQFQNYLIEHRVQTSGLRLLSGMPAPADLDFTFEGARLEATSTLQKQTTLRGFALRDLKNNPFPVPGYAGGTLVVTANGDWGEVDGPDFVKKMIFRRLVTRPGDFFHLPNYGVGLREKEPIPAPDLSTLKKRIQMQVAQEPEIETSRVDLVFKPSESMLFVLVQAKLYKTGQQVYVEFPFKNVSAPL